MAKQKTFNEVLERDLQEQAKRFRKDSEAASIGISGGHVVAKKPDLPPDDVEVICQFCRKSLSVNEPDVGAKIREVERRFRTCKSCRDQIVSGGGILDRTDPILMKERGIK